MHVYNNSITPASVPAPSMVESQAGMILCINDFHVFAHAESTPGMITGFLLWEILSSG